MVVGGSIPLLSPDLNRHDSVNEIVDVLEHLDKLVNTIFTDITTKCRETSERLKNVNARTKSAQIKLQKITGRNKATQVI